MIFKKRRERKEAVQMCDAAIVYLKPAAGESSGDVLVVESADAPVTTVLGHGLLEMYVVDAGSHFEFVQGRHLEAAGVTTEQLRERAMENLAAYVGDVRVVPQGEFYVVLEAGGIESSLFLLDHFWDEALRDYVADSFTIAVPARDLMAFCDADNEAGKAELRELIHRVWSDDEVQRNSLVSDKLFTRRDGVWEPAS